MRLKVFEFPGPVVDSDGVYFVSEESVEFSDFGEVLVKFVEVDEGFKHESVLLLLAGFEELEAVVLEKSEVLKFNFLAIRL